MKENSIRRRPVGTAAISAAVLLALLLGSCGLPGGDTSSGGTSGDNGYSVYSRQFLGTFDTVITVIGHVRTDEEFAGLYDYAEKRFNELNKLYDIYHSYDGINNARTVNEQAGKAPVVIPKDLMDVLKLSVDWYAKTSGKINVVFGSVLSVWHRYRAAADPESDDNPLPTADELAQAALHTSIGNLVLDEANMTAYLTDPESSIDLGAVAKGYATKLVCGELKAKGYASFAISAGGNVEVVGKPLAKDRDTWIIGIQDPSADLSAGTGSQLIDKVDVVDTSVVTSGWYQRYFRSGGKVYHHIIDPDTLYPLDLYQSVTIVYPDSGICDLLSTALMLMPLEQGRALLDTIPGAEAYWVMADGSVRTTPGMDAILESKKSP